MDRYDLAAELMEQLLGDCGAGAVHRIERNPELPVPYGRGVDDRADFFYMYFVRTGFLRQRADAVPSRIGEILLHYPEEFLYFARGEERPLFSYELESIPFDRVV